MVKKSIKLLVSLATIAAINCYAGTSQNLMTSNNFFQPRPFSENIAREMLMEGNKHIDHEGWYGTFSATGVYQRQWNQSVNAADGTEFADTVNSLGVFPFWSGTNSMTVGTNADSAGLDAYQFGLGQVTTAGSITLNPLVWQAGADFMFTVGSSANEPCFFAKIKAPIAVYNINMNLTETDAVLAGSTYAGGQLAVGTSAVTSPASTMTQAFAGALAGGQNAAGDFTQMQYGLINGDQSTGAKFGDIEMTAGYRFISNEDNSFSVAVRASAPTGGEATGVYMLEPIVGRGGNWGLGGYVDGHVKMWEGNNENSWTFKVMGYALHLFNADTVRSYDLLANGAGSKYLLVANYTGGIYNSQIQNLINYSTLASTSSFSVEGDAAISFAYMGRGWTWDIGYEFYGRSAETLEITGNFANEAYAVLGRQYIGTTTGVAANYCQPFAQINLSATATQPTAVNSDTTTVASAQTDVVNPVVAANRIALADLNVAGAQQNAYLTSKVFTKVTYEWVDSDYRPHLGVMGEFEISNSDNNALPQWAVSLVGGVCF